MWDHVDPMKAHQILEKFPSPVPRYTSYPTAPHFAAEGSQGVIAAAIGSIKFDEPISLYLHIPFCDRLCWFCGCHTKQVRRYDPIEAYVCSLLTEIDLYKREFSFRPKLSKLHFGGGSPSILRSDDLKRLRNRLESAFEFLEDTEISIEVDPSDMSADTLEGLRFLGVTRASIGVQDFDEAVQASINRPQSFHQTAEVVEALREIGMRSLNIDALYGLPKQTIASVKKTVGKVISLRPDRVALFGYAHVPWMKKHQRMIDEADLPDQIQRFDQNHAAEDLLVSSGYRKIGIDHFALLGDDLATAAETGHLHRNFQGYTTDDCDVMIGLGASSIGRFPGGFMQNQVATGLYKAAVAQGKLPVAKGFFFNRDDVVRGWLIERLMCDFEISFAAFRLAFAAESEDYLAELVQLSDAEKDGLCASDRERFFIPDEARPFVRIIASRIDAYFGKTKFRYSKAV